MEDGLATARGFKISVPECWRCAQDRRVSLPHKRSPTNALALIFRQAAPFNDSIINLIPFVFIVFLLKHRNQRRIVEMFLGLGEVMAGMGWCDDDDRMY